MKKIKLLVLALALLGLNPMQGQNVYQAVDQHENQRNLTTDNLKGSSDFYFYEDFTAVPDYEIPDNWTKFETTTDLVYCNSGTAHMMRQNSAMNPIILATPLIDLEPAGILKFDHGESSGIFDDPSCIFGYMTDVEDAESFVEVETFYPQSDWNEFTIDVASINGGIGEVYLAWKHTSSFMSYFSLDNVTLTNKQSGESYSVTFNVKDEDEDPISGASVTLEGIGSETTNESGIATFDATPGLYNYNVIAAGFSNYSGEVEVTNADVIENVVLEIASETDYYFYEDFETAADQEIPEDWTRVYTDPDRVYCTNGKAILFRQSSEMNPVILATPLIDMGRAGILTFDFGEAFGIPEVVTCIFGYMTDAEDAETFVEVETFYPETEWDEFTIAATSINGGAGEIYLAWKLTSGGMMSHFSLDNVRLTYGSGHEPILTPPTNLTAEVVDDTNIKLTWDAPAKTFKGYNVYKRDVLIAENITPATFTDGNLLPGSYEYYVRASYDDGLSKPTETVTATIEGGVDRNFVVLELVTDTESIFCPGASIATSELIEQGYDVAVIKYHISDTFANPFSVQREIYYDPYGIPSAYFDGIIEELGGDPVNSIIDRYLPHYHERINLASFFTLDASVVKTPENYWSITVDAEMVYETDNKDYALHVAITESNIEYEWGINQTEVNNVVRLMAPDADGTSLNFANENSHQVVLDFDISEDYVLDNLELIVFLQDVETKEIVQSQKIVLTSAPIISPPTNLTAEVVDDVNVKLAWDAPAKALKGYHVYRNDDLIAENISETTYLDENLEPSTYKYYVRALYDEGLSAPTETVTISLTTSIDEDHMESISIYPNPASGFVNVVTSAQNAVLRVMDIQGRILLTKQLNRDSQQIDISQFNSGLYLFVISTELNTHTQRVIVK